METIPREEGGIEMDFGNFGKVGEVGMIVLFEVGNLKGKKLNANGLAKQWATC
ncbi:MAG: hypothetical protein IPO94_10645 [Saprospiraceae bacterium]|nr:hypothetical protein [Saprospiraceae bacterium]